MGSQRVAGFTESVIREMTRLCQRYGAINLAQGFPDFDPPITMKKAASKAIYQGFNQYSITHGSPKLRQAIAHKMKTYNHVPCDPDENVTVAITDEIYEHILYDDRTHVSIGSLDGMANRTITISGFSKTYSATGWRVGYIVAPKNLTGAVRKVHDFLTVCAPTPLQEACLTALKLPSSYYDQLRKLYNESRNLLLAALENASFQCTRPEGAYYIWTDIRETGFKDDRELAKHLITKVGVGAVPGSSFYHQPSKGKLKLRFSFSKKPETIRKATRRLAKLYS